MPLIATSTFFNANRPSVRLGINPGPLKLRGDVPRDDPDAGRCAAMLKNGSGRCLNDAKVGDLCGVHANRGRS